jgi:uncharacterized membrane protein
MTEAGATPGRGPIDVDSTVREAWALFVRDPLPYVLAMLIYVGLALVTCGLALLVFGVFLAGLTVMALKGLRGGRPVLGDAFAGFQQFGQLFLLWIVTTLFVVIGTLACVLPGIYLMLAFSLATPLVVDRRMGFWDALTTSWRAFHANLGPMLLVTLVLYLINVAGGLIPLGSLVTQPLYLLGITVLYARVFGLNPEA